MAKIKDLPSYTVPLEDNWILEVKPTANAWWKHEPKVHLLLAALREGYKIKEACKQARINLRQYKYFAQRHPEMFDIRQFFRKKLTERAERSVALRIAKDKRFALKYLTKKKPEEFPPPRLLKKIAQLEKDFEEERNGYLEELRQVKLILGMYAEVANELKPELGGWFKRRVEEAEQLVRRYNGLHKSNKERIPRHPKTTQPEKIDS